MKSHFIRVATKYPRSIGRNALLPAHGTGPTTSAAILRTDDGASGWGLTDGVHGDPSALLGRRLDHVFDPSIGVTDQNVLWADFALHDLAGVIAGASVHTMLGDHGRTRGTRENTVPVYDGSIYFDDLDPVEDPAGIDAILNNVQAGWDNGHRSFKLKIGRGFSWMPECEGFARDVEVVHSVKNAFPSACRR